MPTPPLTSVRLVPSMDIRGNVRAPANAVSWRSLWLRSRSTPMRPPASADTSSRSIAPFRSVAGSNRCDMWWVSRSLFRPALRRYPRRPVGADFIRPAWRQHTVGPRADIAVQLRDLSFVEQLVPGLHALVGVAVLHFVEELRQRHLGVGLDQARSERRTDGVLPVA